MQKRAIAVIAIAVLICLAPAAGQALEAYYQDFDGMDLPSEGALLGDGWLVYANVFGYDWGWWYGYGAFAAPNDGAAFCAVVAGEGMGAQSLSVYSDYNNANHVDGIIESNVFQEQMITAGDIGEIWTFDFLAKMGNLAGSTTAEAYIKTLNPAAGYATTNHIKADMTTTPASWNTYSISISIDAGLVGQVLQFGFTNFARLYEGSGVFYDGVNFYTECPVSGEDSTWGEMKSLFR